MDKNKIGQIIFQLRKSKKLTQKDFAARLNVTDKAVSKWERGLACPDISLLLDIANVLDVDPIVLLKGEIDAEQNKSNDKREIVYSNRKDIPNDELHRLYIELGWTDGNEPAPLIERYNFGFLNSTVAFSAWHNGRLVGCVRVLSDKIFRSVIYDLGVTPEYQNQGIGKELVRRCMECFPDSVWLVQANQDVAGYFKQFGFNDSDDVFQSIQGKWF
jgi:transcriptional regulator with XRE-family HTH domain